MQDRYYIQENGKTLGPLDLVGLIKKIRNGTVRKDTKVSKEADGEFNDASGVPELDEFFRDLEEGGAQRVSVQIADLSLKNVAQRGIRFLQLNPFATVYVAVFLLIAVTLALVSTQLPILGFLISVVLSFVMFSLVMYSMLRLARGQLIEFEELRIRLRASWKELAKLSGLIAIGVMVLGLLVSFLTAASVVLFVVLAIPALFAVTFLIFVPLLILERNMPWREAVATSSNAILGGGTQNLGVIFAVIVTNLVAAVLFVFPLLVVLPASLGALCELYDEMFH